MAEWKYGTVVRRAVTKNPVQYQLVMVVGSPPPGQRMRFFIGLYLNEPPPLAQGEWIIGSAGKIRKQLCRDLFEEVSDE